MLEEVREQFRLMLFQLVVVVRKEEEQFLAKLSLWVEERVWGQSQLRLSALVVVG